MSDQAISYIRTISAIVAGSVLSFLAVHGVKLDTNSSAALVIFLTGLFTGAYYLIVRILEEDFHPKFGWLLGFPLSPVYSQPSSVTPITPSVSAPMQSPIVQPPQQAEGAVANNDIIPPAN